MARRDRPWRRRWWNSARRGVRTLRVSAWYRTAPVPASDQPWYVNAVAEVASGLPADALLAELHAVEAEFGRRRTVPNAARPIDLDLLDYHGEIAAGGPGRATLPHPRMTGRAFVLRPLADVAPDWRHPVTGQPSGSYWRPCRRTRVAGAEMTP